MATLSPLGKRLEEALLPSERAALYRTLEATGIHPEGWWHVTWLRLWAEAHAVPAEADRIQEEEGCARERAVIGACFRLEVNPDTYLRRTRQHRRESRAAESAGEIRLSTSA